MGIQEPQAVHGLVMSEATAETNPIREEIDILSGQGGTNKVRRIVEFAVTLGIGATLLAVTLYFVDMRSVGDRLSQIGYGAVALAGVMAFAQVILCAVRWHFVTRQTKTPLSMQNALLGYVEATFVNAFFPTLVASDGARVLRATASGSSPTNAFVGVVTDRIVALCGLGVASLTGLFILPDAAQHPLLMMAIVGILPAFLLGLVVLDIAGRIFVRFSGWRIVRPFLELASYVRRLRSMPRLTLLVVAISITGHAFCAAAFYILGLQLGIDIGYWPMFALAASILVYAAVPLSIGGWGIREAVTAALFGLVGVAPSAAVALSIAFGLLMSVVGFLCGIAALLVSVRRRTADFRRRAAT
jgi:uncharacterized membrane protein YbhN (UPF0104 family)